MIIPKNGNIVVLGAGESGVGAALLAKKKGYNVFVSDFGEIKTKYKDELEFAQIKFEEKGHDVPKILKADVVIKSPGIPNALPLIKLLKEKNIIVIGEIEFAAQFSNAVCIGITGSNGKTTSTNLLFHILNKSGLNVEMAGNVGISMARCLLENNPDFFVLELSSFQLEDMIAFKPHIFIVLNIVADHLDRYDYDINKYGAAKFNVVSNMNINDYLIYNLDDEQVLHQIKNAKVKAKLVPFSLHKELKEGGYLDEKLEKIIININNKFDMSIHDLALKGRHNVQNSLAAGLASRLVDIRKESIRESLSDFTNVEHRLEFVAKVNGISFINDSKATNINAAWFALESMTEPTVWIVGGVDKGNDYDELLDLVKDKVKSIVCLGVNNQKIIEAFSGVVEQIVEANSAQQAVAYAYQLAKKNETVLLSPACASFDLFENYEDRGNQFKRAIRLI